MDGLAQRIAAFEAAGEAPRESLDRGDLEGEADVGDLRGRASRRARSVRRRDGRARQGRRAAPGTRAPRRASRPRRRARRERPRAGRRGRAAIVLAAILQVVDHLQRRAQRVGGGPGRLVLAVHVEDEAADRRRREPAVIHQLGPIGVAGLAHVEAEGVEQVEGVAGRKAALAQSEAQGFGLRIGRSVAAKRVERDRRASRACGPAEASDDRRRRRRRARSGRRRGWARGGERSTAATRRESSRRDGSCRRAPRSPSSCAARLLDRGLNAALP